MLRELLVDIRNGTALMHSGLGMGLLNLLVALVGAAAEPLRIIMCGQQALISVGFSRLGALKRTFYRI